MLQLHHQYTMLAYTSTAVLSVFVRSAMQGLFEVKAVHCFLRARGCNHSIDARSQVKCPGKAPDEVRIAFIILVSDSSWKGAADISVLQEMLHILDDPAFQILIHVDQNSSPQLKAAVAVLVQQPRTGLVQNQLSCTWGGEISLVLKIAKELPKADEHLPGHDKRS